jgi:hypothetical protein
MLIDSFNNPTYSNQNGNNLNKSKFEGFLAISLFQNLKWRMKQPNQLNNDEYGLKKEINVDIDQVLILYYIHDKFRVMIYFKKVIIKVNNGILKSDILSLWSIYKKESSLVKYLYELLEVKVSIIAI